MNLFGFVLQNNFCLSLDLLKETSKQSNESKLNIIKVKDSHNKQTCLIRTKIGSK